MHKKYWEKREKREKREKKGTDLFSRGNARINKSVPFSVISNAGDFFKNE